MQMTGHKTRAMSERYNIVSAGDLRDAAQRLDRFAAGAASEPRTARGKSHLACAPIAQRTVQ